MHEMGKLGRTVLHSSTMKPIKNNKQLTIHIKNTLEPAKAGTKITLEPAKAGSVISTIMESPSGTVHFIGNKIGSYDQHSINIKGTISELQDMLS